MLQCVVVCCSVLQCVAVVVSLHRASSRPKDIVCCSMLQRVARYCGVMQCVVVSCSVVQYDDVYFSCCFYVGP